MLRRLTACLLALLLLAAVPARAAEVADLAILSQWDERFYDQTYRYNNNFFRYGGCGPAAVTNALIAALDVTDQDQAADLLLDVMRLLTNGKQKKSRIQIAWMSYLNFTKPSQITDERYPTLNQLLRDFGGYILYNNGYITPESLEDALSLLGNYKALYHGSLGKTDHWANLCAMAKLLMDSGHGDATIVVGLLGAGTSTNIAPFRSGDSGHYLSICLPVQEFCETGVFYVLDSMPRALEGEPYGLDLTYMIPYDFVGEQKFLRSLARFNELFTVERVQTTILRVRPIGDALKALTAATRLNRAPLDALEPYLTEVMRFFGTSHILFTLPAH